MEKKPKFSLRVVLVRPRNPGNIGACARVLANFGVLDWRVVDPYPPMWKETRSTAFKELLAAAPEAGDAVEGVQVVKTWEEAVKGCVWVLGTSSFHQRPLEHAVFSLPQLPIVLRNAVVNGRIALVFGSERSGLSNEELQRCQHVIYIPTNPKTPSMNLAQAVAVVLYQWSLLDFSSRSARNVPTWEPALQEEMIREWDLLAAESGYPPGYTSAARMGRLRHAVRGVSMSPEMVVFMKSFSRWLRRRLARKDTPSAERLDAKMSNFSKHVK